jgi:flagellar basal body-associated protein FliL
MDMASLVEFVVSSELEKFMLSREFLKPGDKLEGKIIDIKRNGKALIDFGKFRAVAETKFPVKLGEALRVIVDSRGPRLTFRLDNPQLNVSAETREFIGKMDILPEKALTKIQAEIQRLIDSDSAGARKLPRLIKEALAGIRDHFEPLNTTGDLLKLVTRLKTHIQKSGIFFEKDLETAINKLTRAGGKIPDAKELARSPGIRDILTNDLKPNLLVLKDYLDRPAMLREAVDLRQIETLRRTVDDLLNNINNQQNSAVEKQSARQEMQDVQMFQFNLPLKESEKNAKLKVYYSKKDDKEGKKKKGFRLSLLLSMEHIGDIRTDFLLREKDLNITFFVKNHAIRDKIESHVPEIKEPLEEIFDYLVFKVYVSEKKIAEFDTEDLEIISTRMVDVKV